MMKYIKQIAYIGGMIGGSLYALKFGLYLYRSRGRVTIDDLVNL